MEVVKRAASGAYMLALPAARLGGSNMSAKKEKKNTHDGAKKPGVSSEADI